MATGRKLHRALLPSLRIPPRIWLVCLNLLLLRRFVVAVVGFQRRQQAASIATRRGISHLRPLALKFVEVGVHPVDGRVECRALTDAAAEQ